MALGALQDMEGLRQAAARKLVGRHWAQWRQLADACDAMDACAQVRGQGQGASLKCRVEERV